MSTDTIIVDSNALIYSVRYNIDIGKQLSSIGFSRIIVPDCVINELHGLSARINEARAAAAIATRFEKATVTGACDSAIIVLAQSLQCALLTNDREMIMTAKEKLLKVYSLKRKSIIGAV
ncbi:MAG: PIN domain-containing protein [Thermoplasmataceae archaeon]